VDHAQTVDAKAFVRTLHPKRRFYRDQSQFSVAPALTPLQYFRAAIDTTREP
jgi:hypothetical protein